MHVNGQQTKKNNDIVKKKLCDSEYDKLLFGIKSIMRSNVFFLLIMRPHNGES